MYIQAYYTALFIINSTYMYLASWIPLCLCCAPLCGTECDFRSIIPSSTAKPTLCGQHRPEYIILAEQTNIYIHVHNHTYKNISSSSRLYMNLMVLPYISHLISSDIYQQIFWRRLAQSLTQHCKIHQPLCLTSTWGPSLSSSLSVVTLVRCNS